ncbi:tRNA N6-adenosine threonylcarbamoyltransferase, mitochondrial [Planococcus citri]|uniref:tRNA N6-adenosine threonylcarbamoyltransferase, mitochondrial n=1 Tax=Planococcus citri TaxID=170843 RepID=UPI0031F8AB35
MLSRSAAFKYLNQNLFHLSSSNFLVSNRSLHSVMKFPPIARLSPRIHRESIVLSRKLANIPAKPTILGIESSCDDTAAAIVNAEGSVLGEHLISQSDAVLRHGGVLPLIARDLHRKNIHSVVEHTFEKANMSIHDVDAIAVTVKPGLVMSIMVGMEYAKELCKNHNKLLIPVHHMKAHALTVRLSNRNVQFPFLTFLISGGHCILAIANSVDNFSILGQTLDDAPGEAFDKIARRLKAHNISKCRNSSGGAIIEELAEGGNPTAFQFTEPLQQYRDCNFSFSGMKTQALRYIEKEEKKFETEPDETIESISDFCASFQMAVSLHLCRRLQRAMEFVQLHHLLPANNLQLVVSGGTASNKYIRRAFEIVCSEKGYTLYVPSSRYCTDNGIMIAWNGVEKYLNNIDLLPADKIDDIEAEPRCPLGEDLTELVVKANIKCAWIKVAKKLIANDNTLIQT